MDRGQVEKYGTYNEIITKTVTVDKWQKGKKFITALVKDTAKNPNTPLEY